MRGAASPTTTTVRIRTETREALRELEARTGEGTQELLARAVDQFRRSVILTEANAGFGNLRADAKAWSELQAERDEWDPTLGDGSGGDR